MGGNGTVINNGTSEGDILLGTNSLTLLDVRNTDAGLYSCNVKNDFGTDMGETSLLVYKDQNALNIEISDFQNLNDYSLCHDTSYLTFQVNMN